MKTILEQVKSETAERIAAQAQACGLSVEAYLQYLLALASGVQSEPASVDTNEFMAAMDSLAEENTPPLPRDFSREDIYFPEA